LSGHFEESRHGEHSRSRCLLGARGQHRDDKLIADKYLYNRCHLIGYQLSGENANRKNLITGTRYLNVEGMLPFEDMVANYIKATDHHVLYRVRPIFYKKDLVARGVQMEAQSVEDDEISFNVFIYKGKSYGKRKKVKNEISQCSYTA